MRILLLMACLIVGANSFGSSSDKILNTLIFNLQCTKNDWEFRLNSLMDRIVKIDPDVISFQELCSSDSVDMVEYLRKGLLQRKYPLKSITKKFTHPAWDKYREYIGIFSKHQFEKTVKGFLPKSPLQRSFVGALINGTWYVNTHLEHRADYAPYRYTQIKFLIDKFKDKNHVIMGDFNSEPSSREQKPFKENKYAMGFPGPTRPSDRPEKAIDGFWISKELRSNLRGFKAVRMFMSKVGGIYLSDHLGVYLFNDKARSSR